LNTLIGRESPGAGGAAGGGDVAVSFAFTQAIGSTSQNAVCQMLKAKTTATAITDLHHQL
jgi:hypothetical protein